MPPDPERDRRPAGLFMRFFAFMLPMDRHPLFIENDRNAILINPRSGKPEAPVGWTNTKALIWLQGFMALLMFGWTIAALFYGQPKMAILTSGIGIFSAFVMHRERRQLRLRKAQLEKALTDYDSMLRRHQSDI